MPVDLNQYTDEELQNAMNQFQQSQTQTPTIDFNQYSDQELTQTVDNFKTDKLKETVSGAVQGGKDYLKDILQTFKPSAPTVHQPNIPVQTPQQTQLFTSPLGTPSQIPVPKKQAVAEDVAKFGQMVKKLPSAATRGIKMGETQLSSGLYNVADMIVQLTNKPVPLEKPITSLISPLGVPTSITMDKTIPYKESWFGKRANLANYGMQQLQKQSPFKEGFKAEYLFNPEWIVENAAKIAPIMVSSYATGGISTTPAISNIASSLFIGAIEAGGWWDEAKPAMKEGKLSVEDAITYASTVGAINGYIENAPGLGRVSEFFKKSDNKAIKDSFKKYLFKTLINTHKEAMEEPVQKIVQDFVAKIGYDPERKVFDAPELLGEYLSAFVSFLPISGVHGVGEYRQNKKNVELQNIIQDLKTQKRHEIAVESAEKTIKQREQERIDSLNEAIKQENERYEQALKGRGDIRRAEWKDFQVKNPNLTEEEQWNLFSQQVLGKELQPLHPVPSKNLPKPPEQPGVEEQWQEQFAPQVIGEKKQPITKRTVVPTTKPTITTTEAGVLPPTPVSPIKPQPIMTKQPFIIKGNMKLLKKYGYADINNAPTPELVDTFANKTQSEKIKFINDLKKRNEEIEAKPPSVKPILIQMRKYDMKFNVGDTVELSSGKQLVITEKPEGSPFFVVKDEAGKTSNLSLSELSVSKKVEGVPQPQPQVKPIEKSWTEQYKENPVELDKKLETIAEKYDVWYGVPEKSGIPKKTGDQQGTEKIPDFFTFTLKKYPTTIAARGESELKQKIADKIKEYETKPMKGGEELGLEKEKTVAKEGKEISTTPQVVPVSIEKPGAITTQPKIAPVEITAKENFIKTVISTKFPTYPNLPPGKSWKSDAGQKIINDHHTILESLENQAIKKFDSLNLSEGAEFKSTTGRKFYFAGETKNGVHGTAVMSGQTSLGKPRYRSVYQPAKIKFVDNKGNSATISPMQMKREVIVPTGKVFTGDMIKQYIEKSKERSKLAKERYVSKPSTVLEPSDKMQLEYAKQEVAEGHPIDKPTAELYYADKGIVITRPDPYPVIAGELETGETVKWKEDKFKVSKKDDKILLTDDIKILLEPDDTLPNAYVEVAKEKPISKPPKEVKQPEYGTQTSLFKGGEEQVKFAQPITEKLAVDESDLFSKVFNQSIEESDKINSIKISQLNPGDKVILAKDGFVYTRIDDPKGGIILKNGKSIVVFPNQIIEIKGDVNSPETYKSGSMPMNETVVEEILKELKSEKVKGERFKELMGENSVDVVYTAFKAMHKVPGEENPLIQAAFNLMFRTSELTKRERAAFLDEVNKLCSDARHSRKFQVIPLYKEVVQYLETKKGFDKLTPAEQKLATFLTDFFDNAKDVMTHRNEIEDYITHLRMSFFEDWKRNGILSAFKDMFKGTFTKNDAKIINISKMMVEKKMFNPYEIQRLGGIQFSYDIPKIMEAYSKVYFTNKNFRPIMDNITTLATVLKAAKLTDSERFIEDYSRIMLGKPIENISWGKFVKFLSFVDHYTTWQYLFLNAPAGTFNTVVGLNDNFANLELPEYVKGIKRFETRRGQQILNKQQVIDLEEWRKLSYGARRSLMNFIKKAGFFGMTGLGRVPFGERFIQGMYYLGKLTPEEFFKQEISDKRNQQLLTEIADIHGAYRENLKMRAAHHPIGKFFLRFKKWFFAKASKHLERLQKTFKGQEKWKYGKTWIREVVGIGVIIAMYKLYQEMFGDEDRDKPLTKALTRYLFKVYGIPQTLRRGVEFLLAPPVYNTVQDSATFMDAVLKNDTTYKTNTKYGKKGESKLPSMALNLTPLRKLRPYILEEPTQKEEEEPKQFYNRNTSRGASRGASRNARR